MIDVSMIPLLTPQKSIFISALTDGAKRSRGCREGDWQGTVFCWSFQSDFTNEMDYDI